MGRSKGGAELMQLGTCEPNAYQSQHPKMQKQRSESAARRLISTRAPLEMPQNAFESQTNLEQLATPTGPSESEVSGSNRT
eukprot:2294022-Pyramimonas_sp.AAC.1